jgi:endoglucanase
MSFTITRGTNISEWLSQSSRRGAARAAFFTSQDVAWIANLGFDHVRLPVDEEQLWDSTGRRNQEAFTLLDAALDWCAEYGLKVIIDLHTLRSHHFISAVEPTLFSDPAETSRFARLWQDLSDFLSLRPVTQVAYELLNEPVARHPSDWNRVAWAGFAAIRQNEPRRTILLGSNHWNQTHTFNNLDIPPDDHLILTFHYYRPMLITHHQAVWWEGGFWAGPVHYPGQPISDADLRFLNPDFLSGIPQWSNIDWNRERIREDLQLPLQIAERAGCQLYCGEWGAYHQAPQVQRFAWYHDMISLFKEYSISWSNWDYKGGFAPVIQSGQPTDIVPILLA